MSEAISNTSPLLYLYRVGVLDWLPRLFNEIWIPNAVSLELGEGQRRGYDVPERLTLDLGVGELNALALALENQGRIVLLDDGLRAG